MTYAVRVVDVVRVDLFVFAQFLLQLFYFLLLAPDFARAKGPFLNEGRIDVAKIRKAGAANGERGQDLLGRLLTRTERDGRHGRDRACDDGAQCETAEEQDLEK